MADTITPTSVVLADDHHLVRHGLKLFLEAEPDLHVVAEAGDGLEALELVERLKPDLLILDLFMPALNGVEVLQRLRKRHFSTKPIILSMHMDDTFVSQALRAGACGYVLKQSAATTLIHAVREVLAGRRYLSSPLSDRAIDIYMANISKPDAPSADPILTLREAEVLAFVAHGHTNAEIARRMKISRRTVEHHRASVMRKLKCRNQAELIRQALLRQSRFPAT